MSAHEKGIEAAKTPLPWGINTIASMIGGPGIQSSRDGLIWSAAVPVPYHKNWYETIRAAWWVLTGKAEAVIWPKAGELEVRALSARVQEQNRLSAIVSRHLDMVGGFPPGENDKGDPVSRGYANACLNILREVHGPRYVPPAPPASSVQP